MRVMALVKATEDSEKGFKLTPETKEMMEAMGRFNDELANAGIMKLGDCDGTVTDGPFAHPRELVTGFWLWNVKDIDEAVAWVKRCRNPMAGPSEIEIRPMQEIENFE